VELFVTQVILSYSLEPPSFLIENKARSLPKQVRTPFPYSIQNKTIGRPGFCSRFQTDLSVQASKFAAPGTQPYTIFKLCIKKHY
jgi:hypothetical protein